MTLPHISVGWYLALGVTSVGALLYPVILALVARRRLGVSWRYFGYGALIFLLFQIVSRIPLVTVAGLVLKPELHASRGALFAWLTVLALSAGLFEEVGRYVGYRWLMGKEPKTWDKAVMYGIGHGGLEAIVLVGLGDLRATRPL